jgi:hypothetical protein
MLRHRIAASAASAALAAVLLTACSWNDGTVGPTIGDAAVVDFGLLDVNPTSPRADQIVSPRDYLGSVSAWYFGHST